MLEGHVKTHAYSGQILFFKFLQVHLNPWEVLANNMMLGLDHNLNLSQQC